MNSEASRIPSTATFLWEDTVHSIHSNPIQITISVWSHLARILFSGGIISKSKHRNQKLFSHWVVTLSKRFIKTLMQISGLRLCPLNNREDLEPAKISKVILGEIWVITSQLWYAKVNFSCLAHIQWKTDSNQCWKEQPNDPEHKLSHVKNADGKHNLVMCREVSIYLD